MDVLKHFEFFRIEVTQQASSFDIQSMPDDADRILRANLSGLIGPGQMIGIDRVPAFRVNHQWFGPIRQDKVLCAGIQRTFIPVDRHFSPLNPEQRDRDIVENRLFFLFKQTSLLSIDLPLHLISFGLGKGEF